MNNTPELPTSPEKDTLGDRAIVLVDQRFERLVVVELFGRNKTQNLLWLCQCDCGKTVVVTSTNLRTGNTRSCGCLRRDTVSARHAKSYSTIQKHPLHPVWKGLVHRCTNPKNIGYKNYGGRGITVCEEWKTSPQTFYNHVSKLEHYGKSGYSLDRIDNSQGYFPGNVRWATRKEQCRNTRKNVLLTYNGKTQCIAQWAEDLEIKAFTIRSRLNLGWSIERIFTQKVRGKLP